MVATYPLVPHQALADLAADDPGLVLVEFTDDRAYTASELHEQARTVAAGLQRAGHAPGERVALMIGNRAEFLAWWFGTAMAGLVSVPLNTAMRGDVLRHMLALSAPAVLVAEPDYFADAAEAAAGVECPPRVLRLSGQHAVDSTGGFLAGAGGAVIHQARPSAFASIMFTSGTTGPSKGVMWTHRMGMGKAESAVAVMGYDASDVLFTCLPLFHANGLGTSFLAALITRARLVVAPRFSASGFWPAVTAAGATTVNMLGSMPALLWKREPSPEERAHRLRKALVIPPPVGYAEEFEARFNVECTQLYGSTDLGIPLGVPHGERRPGSCGRVLPGWECQIVDDQDDLVPAGQAGELIARPLRPYLSQLGYYGMADATVSAWRNLWFHTGDVMRRDPDGWYYFLDRSKDSMRKSGENVSSYEVEQVVLSHDAVEDVAAYSVPSELAEDEVMVSVVLRPDRLDASAASIVAWCRDRLPYFAVPRYVDLCGSLPRTPTAKVQKSTLRARGITATTYDAGPVRRPRGLHDQIPYRSFGRVTLTRR